MLPFCAAPNGTPLRGLFSRVNSKIVYYTEFRADSGSGPRRRGCCGLDRGLPLSKVDGGFGFDDEEGVGVGAAGGAEFLASFVEGVSQDGEDDFALGAADEIEAAFLLDELELGGHFC